MLDINKQMNFNPIIVRLKQAHRDVRPSSFSQFQSYNSSIKTLNTTSSFLLTTIKFQSYNSSIKTLNTTSSFLLTTIKFQSYISSIKTPNYRFEVRVPIR